MAPAMNEYGDNLNAEASYLKAKFGKDFDKPCEHTVYLRAGLSEPEPALGTSQRFA